jgi:glutamate/tyrosine decarboxylase-like PLP-dependent enzyme
MDGELNGLAAVVGRAADEIVRFRAGVADRPVAHPVDVDELRSAFGEDVPAGPTAPDDVVAALVKAVEPGLVASAGPRYFGFVVGGALEAATGADLLATGWDQNAFTEVMSPAALAAEHVAGGWAKDLLGIPQTASVGFVTGTQEANTIGIAAGRHQVLADRGWDVARKGLQAAPRLRVVASEERHATVDRSLRLLGLGEDAVVLVRAGADGAVDTDHLGDVLGADRDTPTIVCLQSGNVNTGACDDLTTAVPLAHERGAWVHVDGAFGLWAAASPAYRHLTEGVELADSWGTDAHKWLNVPYDSGLVFVARPEAHVRAASYTAAYLTGVGEGEPHGGELVIGSSRRARGFAVWAAIKQLGRSGVAELVERGCSSARRFAERLEQGGAEIGNEVVLNQVLVRYDDDATTEAVVAGVQREGTCWMGATTWRGRRYMRISVSSHLTTAEDVDRSVEAILRVWHGSRRSPAGG